jgi:hypothetical protein
VAFYLQLIALSRHNRVGYDTCMVQKLTAIAAWMILAFIAYATISPIQDRPTLPTSSNFEHFAAFAVLGGLFCLAYPRQIILVCLIVIGSAILLELIQLLTHDRHGRIQDAIEKMAGGAFGILGGRVFLYFAKASRWLQNFNVPLDTPYRQSTRSNRASARPSERRTSSRLS